MSLLHSFPPLSHAFVVLPSLIPCPILSSFFYFSLLTFIPSFTHLCFSVPFHLRVLPLSFFPSIFHPFSSFFLFHSISSFFSPFPSFNPSLYLFLLLSLLCFLASSRALSLLLSFPISYSSFFWSLFIPDFFFIISFLTISTFLFIFLSSFHP